MKVILNVLAVVALIATCSANFVEFSKDAVKRFSTADTEASPTTAEVINADRDFKFHLFSDVDYEEDAFLYPDELSSSAPGGGHSICGNDLGIHIANLGTFCNASYFHVGMDTYEELSSYEHYGESDEDYVLEEVEETSGEEDNKHTKVKHKSAEENNEDVIENGADDEVSDNKETLDDRAMHFTIYFDSAKTEPCLLEIPILKVPSEIDSLDPEKLKTWAAEHQLGLLSPTDVHKFISVRKEGGLPLNFKWLSDLLKYGVFKTKDDSEEMYTNDLSMDSGMVTFTSRPIVLSEDDLEKVEAWMSAAYSR